MYEIFIILYSSYGAAVLATSFERCRKQKMLYSKGRAAKGGGKAVASDVLGSGEVPLRWCKWRDWEKMGPQIQ